MSDEKVFDTEIEQQETAEEIIQPSPSSNEPVEEISVEETPVEEVPVEEVPVEEAPADAPIEEEKPIEEKPVEENEADSDKAPSETESDPLAEIMKRPPYHERYYLKYNEGKRTAEQDLAGTKNFLNAIGFDGGELLQARQRKEQASVFQNSDRSNKNQMHCSYCGAEIAGVEYYRLPDGRLRCTSCSRSIVSDKEEIAAMCKRVVANMDNFFGATIDVAVAIDVLDERKLKKRANIPLGTRDEQSILVLGVAINKKKKYSILLENGAPRVSLIATFAHELTHIWQYTHWDSNKKLEKCPKDKRLIVYEGMAKWVEIQYLYLIGETTIAKREEYITRNRQDEYGLGFRLYEQEYPLSREAMNCEETPFTPNSYPIDLGESKEANEETQKPEQEEQEEQE